MANNYKYYIAVGSKLIESPKVPTSIRDLINYTVQFANENELLNDLFDNGIISQTDCDNVSSGVTKLRIFKCHEQERYPLESGIPYVDAIPYINYPVGEIKELLIDKNFVNQLQELFSWNNQVRPLALTLSINLNTPDCVYSERDDSINKIIDYLSKRPLYKYQLGMLIKNYDEKKESIEVKQSQFDESELDYVTYKLTHDYRINPDEYDGIIPERIAEEGTSQDEKNELLSLIKRYNACNRGRK